MLSPFSMKVSRGALPCISEEPPVVVPIRPPTFVRAWTRFQIGEQLDRDEANASLEENSDEENSDEYYDEKEDFIGVGVAELLATQWETEMNHYYREQRAPF